MEIISPISAANTVKSSHIFAWNEGLWSLVNVSVINMKGYRITVRNSEKMGVCLQNESEHLVRNYHQYANMLSII